MNSKESTEKPPCDGTPNPARPSAPNSTSVGQVEPEQVGARVRRGAFWSATQMASRQVLSVLSTAILARLISPDDYGLIGMVATLTALLSVFSDMGLSWAAIQSRRLSSAQASNLFWMNAVAGIFFWVICIAVAPAVANFYNHAELRNVTLALGASFAISGLAVQPIALLTRSMEFRRIAQIEIVSLALSAVCAVYAAGHGLGYWALVLQTLVSQSIRMVLALAAAHMPISMPRRGVGTRALVNFGGLLALNGLLIYVARNLDNVLIGKYLGSQELGYYNRAYFLMLLPSMLATGVLSGLMVPALSVLQDDRERFGVVYRRAVRAIAFVGCPISVGLGLTASESVRLVYGDAWAPVVPMLLWLSLAGLTQPIYNTSGWLFTAAGKARSYFAVTCINAAALTGTFIWSVRYGTVAVAAGYGIVMGVVLLLPTMHLAHRAAKLDSFATAKALAPIAVAVALMGVAVTVAEALLRLGNPSWQFMLLAKIGVGVVTYGIASMLLLQEVLGDLASMLPGVRAGAARRVRSAT
jgi:O-antigen/teichoic acid export membrane protein